MKIKETDKAYAAGFVDGDGCIHISKLKPGTRGRVTFQYGLLVCVANTKPQSLEFIKSLFGGSIHKTIKQNHKWEDGYQLQLNPKAAQELLEAIKPYLIIKKDQADLGLMFAKLREANPRMVTQKGCKPSSSIYQKLQEQCYQEMKTLNSGAKKRATIKRRENEKGYSDHNTDR